MTNNYDVFLKSKCAIDLGVYKLFQVIREEKPDFLKLIN